MSIQIRGDETRWGYVWYGQERQNYSQDYLVAQNVPRPRFTTPFKSTQAKLLVT